jgi:hypothetical protein
VEWLGKDERVSKHSNFAHRGDKTYEVVPSPGRQEGYSEHAKIDVKIVRVSFAIEHSGREGDPKDGG